MKSKLEISGNIVEPDKERDNFISVILYGKKFSKANYKKLLKDVNLLVKKYTE
jgi:hypothetical protein